MSLGVDKLSFEFVMVETLNEFESVFIQRAVYTRFLENDFRKLSKTLLVKSCSEVGRIINRFDTEIDKTISEQKK